MNTEEALKNLRMMKASLSTALTKIRKASKLLDEVVAWSKKESPMYKYQHEEFVRLCDNISLLCEEILK